MSTTSTRYLDVLLANAQNRIGIVSGEGEVGIPELFDGRRTRRAIVRRLNRERCAGDRWAYAVIETNEPGRCAGHAVMWDGKDGSIESILFPLD